MTLGNLVEVLPQAVLRKARAPPWRPPCSALRSEVAERRGVARRRRPQRGGLPGIVPAGDPALLHQLAELALGHDGVVDTQPGDLDLAGLGGASQCWMTQS